MIDGLGKALPLRMTPVAGDSAVRGGPAGAVGATAATAAPRSAVTSAGQFVRDMAASPPVDSARVEALRLAIAAGSYKPDPQAIAAKMIALETGSV